MTSWLRTFIGAYLIIIFGSEVEGLRANKLVTKRFHWPPNYEGAKRQNFKPITSAVKDRSLRSDVIGGKSACDFEV